MARSRIFPKSLARMPIAREPNIAEKQIYAKHVRAGVAAAVDGGVPAIVLGTTAAAGSATTLIRTDATIIAFDGIGATASAPGDASATGSADKAARRDHKHQREVFATPSLTFATTNVGGSATTLLRSDAQIALFDAIGATASAVGDASATGSATVAARRDHLHAREAFATPTSVGTANSAGVATTLPRSDHVHDIANGAIDSAALFAAGVVDAAAMANRTVSVWVSAEALEATAGSPSKALVDSSYYRWLFDPASTESVSGHFVVPADWVSGAFTAYLYLSRVSGGLDSVWRLRIGPAGEASTISGVSTQADDTIGNASGADVLKIVAHSKTVTPSAAGDIVGFTLSRIGGDAADACTSDMGLSAIRFDFTRDH